MLTESKLLLAYGITAMSLATMILIFWRVEKEYIMIFAGFAGQLVAAFLTYINAGKQKPPEDKP